MDGALATDVASTGAEGGGLREGQVTRKGGMVLGKRLHGFADTYITFKQKGKKV